MNDRLVTLLLPALVGRTSPAFNVFDVMHHGTHEKQLSNVFAWLLDNDGTHGLGDRFQRVFIDAVNRGRPGAPAIASGSFSVRQEVNIADADMPMDIADLVLEDDHSVLVVENYYTSDGHGHSYEGYLMYGERNGKNSVVVMLCAGVNSALLSDGWQDSAVVAYADLIAPLLNGIESDSTYRRRHPDQVAFFRHLQSRFVKERNMNDDDMTRFIDAMCTSGQAKHYRTQSLEAASVNFADALREHALDQFGESRAWLQRLKAALKNHATRTLAPQLTAVLGPGSVTEASAGYSGIYQWTINFSAVAEAQGTEEPLQLKFGPSAWFANEGDDHWKHNVANPDYTRVFITMPNRKRIQQSEVTLREVLDGLSPEDVRLRDEVVSLLGVRD